MTDDEPMWELMNEKERIDFIRAYAEEHNKEILLKGLKSLLGRNKYKIKEDREHMWNNQFDRGKKLVKGILLYHDD